MGRHSHWLELRTEEGVVRTRGLSERGFGSERHQGFWSRGLEWVRMMAGPKDALETYGIERGTFRELLAWDSGMQAFPSLQSCESCWAQSHYSINTG